MTSWRVAALQRDGRGSAGRRSSPSSSSAAPLEGVGRLEQRARRRAPGRPGGRSSRRARPADGRAPRHARRAPAPSARRRADGVKLMTYRSAAPRPNRAWSRRRSPGTWPAPRPPSRPAATSVSRIRRPGASASRAAAMDRAVLADLERREVEAERLRPASAGPGPRPRRPGRARPRRARRWSYAELGVQDAPRPVAAGARRRALAGEGRARAAEPLGDRAEALAVGLVGEARAGAGASLSGSSSASAASARSSAPVDALAGRRGGDRLHQPRRDRLVAVQDVVGLDAQAACGDVRGHVRVAVAVAADPAPQSRNAGATAAACPCARVDGQRPGPSPWPGPPARDRGPAPASTRPVERGTTVNRVSSKNASAVRTSSSGVGAPPRRSRGAPQERDLLAQAAAEVGDPRRGESRVVEALEQPPASAAARRAASVAGPRWDGRSGPGGPRPHEPGPRSRRRARSPRAARPPRRATRRRPALRATRARRERPYALPLLGEVDELEVERERAGHGRRVLDVERRDLRPEPLPLDVRLGTRSGSPRRRAIVRRRIRSTRSNSSGPACSAMTCPSSEPRKRTSWASGSRARPSPGPGGSAAAAGNRDPRARDGARAGRAARSATGTGWGRPGSAASRRGLRFDCKGTRAVPGRNRFR